MASRVLKVQKEKQNTISTPMEDGPGILVKEVLEVLEHDEAAEAKIQAELLPFREKRERLRKLFSMSPNPLQENERLAYLKSKEAKDNQVYWDRLLWKFVRHHESIEESEDQNRDDYFNDDFDRGNDDDDDDDIEWDYYENQKYQRQHEEDDLICRFFEIALEVDRIEIYRARVRCLEFISKSLQERAVIAEHFKIVSDTKHQTH